MMSSFYRPRCCHVAMVFLLVASAVGSPSGSLLPRTMKNEHIARREASKRARSEAITATTPVDSVEISTETVEQSDTLPSVNSAINTIQPSSENPLSIPMEELPKPGNENKQETKFTTGYQYQQDVPTTRRPERIRARSPTPRRNPNRPISTPTPVFDERAETEREKDEIIHAEDLLAPITESAYLLLQLMNLSTQNLDTAFRGSLKNQSPIVKYSHSFRTTLLEISLKLSNAFLISRTKADEMKMSILNEPSKVKEVTGYLEKFNNSSRMTEFLYFPLKNLKETTDQTFNLSSQIANQFGELTQLVDEVIKTHNFSMLNKEQQVMDITAELHRKNKEKKGTDTEISLIEKEIEYLKSRTQLDEEEFDKAMDNLYYLQSRIKYESRCFHSAIHYDNWDARQYSQVCPYNSNLNQIQQFNETAKRAQTKLEKTMESLFAQEEKATKEREVGNELKIKIERLNHELLQLREDVQLLGNTSNLLNRLAKHQKTLEKSWKKFVVICGNLQSSATKSLNIVEEANRFSTHWNEQFFENILSKLNQTKEDLSLIERIIDIYLEESITKKLREPVTEMEQMMVTKSENPK